MNKKLTLAALSVFALIIFITEANAQCVGCSPQGRKFVCASTTNGGRICQTTSDGRTCAISDPCGSTAIQASGADIVLEERLVAEVERTEPRLAQALSFLRKNPELLASGYVKLYLLPEEAEKSEQDEMSALLARIEEDEMSALLARISERSQDTSPIEPAIYEVTFERSEDSASATLKINPSGQKPNVASTSLILHLTKAERGTWRVSGWDTRPAH